MAIIEYHPHFDSLEDWLRLSLTIPSLVVMYRFKKYDRELLKNLPFQDYKDCSHDRLCQIFIFSMTSFVVWLVADLVDLPLLSPIFIFLLLLFSTIGAVFFRQLKSI